ncbi:hypothetical protein SD71_12350 [Cohnella kolymensis]|uniref:histidine kinase n=1 Tax=Cohnella kolymensis TaxID=1590652 RepID=A0ABR5A529_9BACL|nr:sensor histidine kinase [Cohnella kolymensis]KIL35680.1 hypothetical protein SD71_12350 [Cohnella kolymensis]
MVNFIKTMMSNFMFMLIPPVVYFLYWSSSENRRPKFSPLIMLITLTSSMLLCMSFPYEYQDHFNFDFRHVPIVLGVLYGGPRLGALIVAIFLVYRYVIGGEGVSPGSLITVAVYLSLVYIKSRYHLDTRYKLILAVWISAAIVPIPLLLSLALTNLITFQLAFSFILFRLVQSVAICFIVYLIEFLIDHYKMQSQLQESEKMRVVSELAASVSHEIRNPLTTVKGMLQLLGANDYSKEKKQEYIKMALNELDTSINIISDYLTFSKPQLDNVKPIHLADECKKVINVLTPYANLHQVHLHFSLDPSCIILGDSQKLRQSVINLVKNCIEASKDGTVELIVQNNREGSIIQIRDTGIGMTKEQVNRLGTPYYSTKEKGTGLGSMVAFSLIKAMNGSVTVESEIGKGSRFIIAFPHRVM